MAQLENASQLKSRPFRCKITEDHYRDLGRNLQRHQLLKIIFRLYRVRRDTEDRQFENWVIREFQLKTKVFSIREIRAHHHRLQVRLMKQYPEASTPTWFEAEFVRKLRSTTSLEILQSTWIGNGCVDVFIPGVAGQSIESKNMRGLALEIDGPIHNNEAKMRRDEHKLQQLSMLRIAVSSIQNDQVNHENIANLIRQVSWMPRLDSRARRRLWRDIFIFTLVLHGNREEVSSLLGLPEHLVEELEEGVQ